ncbi:hypothetical protein AFCA_012773 [Aspergillus flavus]|nr:uncharacterized protein G4B84_011864 [Aspergillus flavus NRRL3357]KAF7626663.1 hypothetical protein AFLA_014052 [Aspergillus flavus NRRL3357]QMW36335.1 hypothetical protein G4B84_011864 [Aspergillus flavus NRRL3357]RMZ44215.1 hypothetical protein CA14_004024 [Aspergillus flavus]UDD65597.1 hypothetical protein AFCA_012773 [Aspergillus flavus]
MSDTLGRVKRAFSTLTIRDKKEKKREEIVKTLHEIYNSLNPLPMTIISPSTLANLSIDLHLFNPEGHTATTFFRPLTAAQLAKYPKDLESYEVRHHQERKYSDLDKGADWYEAYGGRYTLWDWGENICYMLAWELGIAPRLGTEKPRPLNNIIKWRGSEGWPVESQYLPMSSSYNEHWEPQYHWRPWREEDSHIKICQYHGIIGSDGQLLREELLVIVGTICTQMNKERFKKHLVIPVMMFSFMGERHGRIILAQFDGDSQKLVVHMSKLYRFLAEDEDSLALFTRYAASVVEPSGNMEALHG